MLGNYGKYKGGKTMGFTFDYDPTELLNQLQSGRIVNAKKDFDFYKTPKAVTDVMFQVFMPAHKDRILEPSAGDGAIIEACLETFSGYKLEFDAIELNPMNRAKLIEKGINLIHDDFLTFELKSRGYNVIYANPPFKNYIDHVAKMSECADHVCFIAPTSLKFKKDRKTKALREFIDAHEGFIEDLPDNSFKESGTGVSCVVAYFEGGSKFRIPQ